MSARRALALLALGQAALGCSSTHERYDSNASAIVEGEASGPEQDGVLLLRARLDSGSEALCTGSLVAPRLLITARHCVSYVSEGVFSCSVRGEPIDNPDGGGSLGLHLPPESIEVYGGPPPRKAPLAHGTQIISTLSPTVCRNDLAFVVLDTPIDAPLVPFRLGIPARVGELGVLVGYGLRKGQDGIDYASQKRQQKRDLVISGVGPDSVNDGVTTVAPRTLLLDGPSGCIGDSGGPLLAQDSGALLGIYSLQEGASCEAEDVRHHLVHVPPFAALIDEAFAAVGGAPQLEPTTSSDAGAGGAAGAADVAAGTSTIEGGASAGAPDAAPAEASDNHDSSGCSISGAAPHLTASPLWLALALCGAALRLRVRRRRAA
ncbi:MAG TPA: trypsin-like serine protease [Polyangiaceae bacterium]|nr:trypsin-like serine protease [Polyangiaceae bacterium]